MGQSSKVLVTSGKKMLTFRHAGVAQEYRSFFPPLDYIFGSVLSWKHDFGFKSCKLPADILKNKNASILQELKNRWQQEKTTKGNG
jgi:hypothetical protein